MQEITLPSGRKALRKDGVLYQEIDPASDRLQLRFAKERWRQNLGAEGTEPPALGPLKMVPCPKAMFMMSGGASVLVPAGDFLARDMEGNFSHIRAEAVRDFAFLPVQSGDDRQDIEEAARTVLERTVRVRNLAQGRAGDPEASPLCVREDENGRGLIVSALPDGREKTWKKFAKKSAADIFLSDEENRRPLEAAHAKACRSAKSVNDMAHVFRMTQKSGSER